MSKKKSNKPPRPKLRRWFPKRGPSWLKLEPARLAMLGGVFFSTCALVLYFVRQLTGEQVDIQDIAIGISLVFLVSYTGTGFFVWYLLHVAESESARRAARARMDEATVSATDEKPPAAQEHPNVEEPS